jgi:hypothetical protein
MREMGYVIGLDPIVDARGVMDAAVTPARRLPMPAILSM